MATPGSWIKLDRNILRWGWYQDANTMRLFVHLLLKASIKDGEYGGYNVKRGDVVTSLPKLSAELNIPQHKIRASIDRLKQTGEISVKSTPRHSVISVLNYDKFQDASPAKPQAERKPRAKRKKEEVKKEAPVPVVVEEPKEYTPLWWEIDKPKEFWGRFKTEDEYWEFRQNGGE